MTCILVHLCLSLGAMNFFSASFFSNIWMEPKEEEEALRMLDQIQEGVAIDIHLIEKYWNYIEPEKKHSALMLFAKAGNLDAVHLLLKFAAEKEKLKHLLHIRSHTGAIALHYAAQAGQIDVVNLLLQSQTDIHTESYRKNTALSLAAEAGHTEVVKILIESGARINHENYRRRSPFCMAAETAQFSVLKTLADLGADINMECEDIEGSQILKSSLRQALERSDDTTALFLLDLGVLDRGSGRGLLPLPFLAIRQSCFQTLIKGIEEKHWNLDERFAEIGHTALSFTYKLRVQRVIDPLLPTILSLFQKTQSKPTLEVFESALHDLEDQRQHVEDLSLLGLIDDMVRMIQQKRSITFLKNWEREINVDPAEACALCGEERPNEAPTLGPSDCGCWLCEDCDAHFLQYAKNSNGFITCPGCAKIAKSTYFERNERLPPEDVVRYLEKQYEKICSRHPNWVACPGLDCPMGRVVEPGFDAYFYCPSCQFKGCLHCQKNHRGACASTSQDDQLQTNFLKRVLTLGKLAPPINGHPKDPNHPNYWKGRIRPCFYCHLPTEKEYQPLTEAGFCNSMVCQRCGKRWHWNFGDAKRHPQNRNQLEEYHDFAPSVQRFPGPT